MKRKQSPFSQNAPAYAGAFCYYGPAMDSGQRHRAQEATRTALRHFKSHGRDLPWRRTRDPYRIFVSEMMLQQTQVSRVIPKYKTFIRAFPSWRALARARFSEVLVLWQGLGYNRRAKYLHEAARIVVRAYGGVLPRDVESIDALPGVGHYTARAIAAFAFNDAHPFVETNIRTVFLHHCFPGKKRIADAEILACVDACLREEEPRALFAALMDYGAHLKEIGVRLNARSAGHVTQKPFRGSLRQERGRILAELSNRRRMTRASLLRSGDERTSRALEALVHDALIERRGDSYRVAS